MPSLAPLLDAGPLITAHAAAAGAALALGIVQLVRRKGTPAHRALGWAWAALMAFIAGGSFAIHTIRQFGPFSWIHALSLFTLVMLWVGVAHARAGRIKAHRWTMISLVRRRARRRRPVHAGAGPRDASRRLRRLSAARNIADRRCDETRCRAWPKQNAEARAPA